MTHSGIVLDRAEKLCYNGTVDPDLSYVLVCEQDAVGSKTDTKDSLQSNGVTPRTLGSIDNKYTFRQLLYAYNPHVDTLPYTYEVLLSRFATPEELKVLANSTNTVHIYVRLATGELKEAFTAVLKVA